MAVGRWLAAQYGTSWWVRHAPILVGEIAEALRDLPPDQTMSDFIASAGAAVTFGSPGDAPSPGPRSPSADPMVESESNFSLGATEVVGFHHPAQSSPVPRSTPITLSPVSPFVPEVVLSPAPPVSVKIEVTEASPRLTRSASRVVAAVTQATGASLSNRSSASLDGKLSQKYEAIHERLLGSSTGERPKGWTNVSFLVGSFCISGVADFASVTLVPRLTLSVLSHPRLRGIRSSPGAPVYLVYGSGRSVMSLLAAVSVQFALVRRRRPARLSVNAPFRRPPQSTFLLILPTSVVR